MNNSRMDNSHMKDRGYGGGTGFALSGKRAACRLFAVVAALILCVSVLIYTGAVYAASDFVITDYDVKMTVNEDDTYQVTETLQVHFTAPSHGIYRSIPRRERLDRDGQLSVYNSGVKDFKVESGQPFKKENDSSQWMWRIGDPDKYADTDTEYVITYLYDTRGDHFKGGDEVYHNIVGDTWEAQSIDHVSWEINFPKDIDPAKVGMKTGNNQDVPFEVTDNRIVTGETDLDTLRGLTIRAVLPEGYFTRQEGATMTVFYLIGLLLAALAGAGAVLWRRHGVDPVYPETIEFYPPEGLSAPDTAFLEKGDIDKQDVISILLTLADRGYLVIHEIEEVKKGKLGRSKTKTTYEIERIREYDGDDEAERMFMEGLFKDAESRPATSFALGTEDTYEGEGGSEADGEFSAAIDEMHLFVKMEDLEDSFYKIADEIRDVIRAKYDGKLYEKDAEKYAKIMYWGSTIGVLILIAAARVVGGLGLGRPPEGFIMLAFQPILMIAGFSTLADWLKDRKGIASLFIGVLLAAGGVILCRFAGTFYGAMTVPFIIGAVMCMILFMLGGLCEKKTEYYAEIQARIRGYRRFLETAEKDRLEMLAEQDPEYYYRNLAYAFALGVTGVYARRFVSMAQTPPQWYDSPHYYHTGAHDHDTGFAPDSFVNSINDMMASVSTSMSSSPSDGGGGGSFSGGGGGGGGGGGSW